MSGRYSTEETCWIALNMVLGVGKTLFYRLVRRLGSAERVFRAHRQELTEVEGIGKKTADQILEFDFDRQLQRELALIGQLDAQVVTLPGVGYPAALKTIYDPPPVLYYQGRPPGELFPALAVVGTRQASSYGKIVTQRLCSELAACGVTLVSGMARGIDTLVHRAALEAGGNTMAVFGCGLDYTYPPENHKLREAIIRQGCVLSEFPISTRPDRNNFPARNRVISGMSLGTLVVEAGEKSGALITAEFSLEQGREVYAVPGNITSPKSQGCNRLIQMGAKMVTEAQSVIEEFPDHVLKRLSRKEETGISTAGLSDKEQGLMALLSEEETPIDDLILNSRLSAAEVSATLVQLELKGLVRQTEGKNFIINRVVTF